MPTNRTLPELIEEVKTLCNTWSNAMDQLILKEGIDAGELQEASVRGLVEVEAGRR